MAGHHRLSDFEHAVSAGGYRIDRTPYIEKYESADQGFVICLRPSGFDKTLLLSMLRFYYSKDLIRISRKLFDKLYIAAHKTSLYGSFTVFYLDFNSIKIHDFQSIASIYQSEITLAIEEYFISQGLPSIITKQDNPVITLHRFLDQYGNKDLFVLINEYDYFHHEILDRALNGFNEAKTGKNQVIRSIYAELNHAMNNDHIGRIFVVGIDSGLDR